MAIKPVPYTQTPDRLINQIQTYIINPLNTLINAFNTAPVSSVSCGAFSTTGVTFNQVTNLNANFTTNGRAVDIKFVPDTSSISPALFQVGNPGNSGNAYIKLKRDNNDIAIMQIGIQAIGSTSVLQSLPPSAISFVDDNAPVGAHSYSLWIAGASSSDVISISNVIMRVSQE